MGVVGAVTFILGGFFWQISHASSDSGSAEVVQSGAPPAPATDVSTRCRKESTAAFSSDGLGNIDAVGHTDTAAPISDLTTIPARTPVSIVGWALPGPAPRPGAAVCLAVDGQITEGPKILYGGSRPDVAAAFKNGALQTSGFSIDVPTGTLGRGKHTFRIVVIDLDGKRSILKVVRTLFFE